MSQATPIGPVVPTQDIQQGLSDLRNFGYAIHENFVDKEELVCLKQRIQEQAECEIELGLNIRRPHYPDGDYMQEVPFLPNKGRCFIDLMMNATALAYADAVIGGYGYKLFTQNGLIIRPGAEGVSAMHCDQQGLRFATPRPMMLNVMLAVENFDEDAGATHFVPGSHLMDLPSLDPDSADQMGPGVTAAVAPGTAILWEGRTWHRAGNNISNKTRTSITTVYCDMMLNPQHVMVASLHDDVYAKLSEEELRVLGFRLAYNTNVVAGRYPGDERRMVDYAEPYVPELHTA